MANGIFRLTVNVEPGALELDKKHVRRVLRAAGNEVAARARRIASGGGSGRIYYGTGGGSSARQKGGYHKFRWAASLPGNAPAKVTGTLTKSFKVTVFRDGEGVSIKNLMFYARFLEVGAEGGGRRWSKTSVGRKYAKGKSNIGTVRKLLPRPFLTRALAIGSNSLPGRIGEAIMKGTKFRRMPMPRGGR